MACHAGQSMADERRGSTSGGQSLLKSMSRGSMRHDDIAAFLQRSLSQCGAGESPSTQQERVMGTLRAKRSSLAHEMAVRSAKTLVWALRRLPERLSSVL